MPSVFLPLGAAVTSRRRMWPEPSVSCLISRPLPGSHGQATFAPRALPREGPAEEENHFSRLASPGRAFLPRPIQKQPQETGLGPARPEVPTFRALRDSGLSWGLRGHVPRERTPSCSKVNPLQGGQGLQIFLCVCQISCLGFRLQSWSISCQSTHRPPPTWPPSEGRGRTVVGLAGPTPGWRRGRGQGCPRPQLLPCSALMGCVAGVRSRPFLSPAPF